MVNIKYPKSGTQNHLDLPRFLFHQGRNFNAYSFFGSHYVPECSKDFFSQSCATVPVLSSGHTACFRVWAPRAKAVSVVGSFNCWDIDSAPMHRLTQDQSIWEVTIPGVLPGHLYKYAILKDNGETVYKSDPYAFFSESPVSNPLPQMASVFHVLDENFPWTDADWLEDRASANPYKSPMNIYEIHLGSWRHDSEDNTPEYRAIAHELINYVSEMGYTHIEIMPLMEHPFDGSWGYQVCGYYSITARFGSPEDFMYLINLAHSKGIAVILDWVPAHFPKDAHGLMEFDGHPLYEDSDVLRMEHKAWGTRTFDFGRPEVVSFLVSNAFFLLDKFHVDGLRVDAVAAMLYLDFDREPEQWRPNAHGGRENLEAVEFIRTLNKEVLTAFPGTLMMAEESTAWPMVTMPPDIGGLGFNFKWNMGWMNDILQYISIDPVFRSGLHSNLTFPLVYAFSENYILPISHDEVVHGKRSLIDKMPGTYEEKFAGLRLFLIHMLTQPGKKLMYMGCELGQFIEWNEKHQLDWMLLKYISHKKLHNFFKKANNLYKASPAMWQCDDSWAGFAWIDADNYTDNVISYMRFSEEKQETLVIVENFSGNDFPEFTVGVPKASYVPVIDTDYKAFGGLGRRKYKIYKSMKGEAHGFEQHITVHLPPLSAIILEKTGE